MSGNAPSKTSVSEPTRGAAKASVGQAKAKPAKSKVVAIEAQHTEGVILVGAKGIDVVSGDLLALPALVGVPEHLLGEKQKVFGAKALGRFDAAADSHVYRAHDISLWSPDAVKHLQFFELQRDTPSADTHEDEVTAHGVRVEDVRHNFLMQKMEMLTSEIQDQRADIRRLLELCTRQAKEMAKLRAEIPLKSTPSPASDPDGYDGQVLFKGDGPGVVQRLDMRTVSEDEMLASSYARAETLFRRLDQDPDMLAAEAFAEKLGISVQALHKKRKSLAVLGLSQATRKVWFPIWQIDGNGQIIKGLAEVLGLFDGDSWAAYRFLVQQSHPGLDGRTGKEALLAGDVCRVLTVAEGICQGGYS